MFFSLYRSWNLHKSWLRMSSSTTWINLRTYWASTGSFLANTPSHLRKRIKQLNDTKIRLDRIKLFLKDCEKVVTGLLQLFIIITHFLPCKAIKTRSCQGYTYPPHPPHPRIAIWVNTSSLLWDWQKPRIRTTNCGETVSKDIHNRVIHLTTRPFGFLSNSNNISHSFPPSSQRFRHRFSICLRP